jgi:hypothetical protein
MAGLRRVATPSAPPTGGHPPPLHTGRTLRVVGLVGVFVATIGLTAATTYALTRSHDANPGGAAATLTGEQTTARKQLCAVFDTAAKNQKGKGGVMAGGTLNVPVVLRDVNRAVALRDALSPAVPAELATATRNYITATLDLSTAATAGEPVPVLRSLTAAARDGANAVADLCGLR